MSNRVFNGRRLQHARTIRGITIAELSDIAGTISKQAISQYENGTIPSIDKVFLIANALHFPVSFFYEADNIPLKVGSTFFRALASTAKKDRTAQVIRTEYIVKLFSILGRYVEFPKLNLPEIEDNNLTSEDVANLLRSFWGISGPIHNVVYWMEKNGIIVSSLPIGSEKIDAFSQTDCLHDDDMFCVILGNEKESAVRRQFCAAHEIGHILMHERNLDIEALSTIEFRQKEDEANRFAGAFLLPEDEFSRDLLKYTIGLDTFVYLKKKWHVSIGAMIIRAKSLGLIDQEIFTKLMKSYSARGWRKYEPLDDSIAMEAPVLAQKAIDLLLDNEVFSVEELLEEFTQSDFSIGAEFIEEALCLRKGTLSSKGKENNVESINIKMRKINVR